MEISISDKIATVPKAAKAKPLARVPRLYRVLLHNDDYTPRHFVVTVLRDIFGMDEAAANAVMLVAHTKGIAACGIYPRDIAETKVKATQDYIRPYELPLRFSAEPA